eukprot:9185083-Karenia_brevis.AAC.1
MPAGLKSCEADAISRWQKSGFAMPPYQYRAQFCVTRPNGVLEPPSATEREILLGYRKHHTAPAV